MTTPNPHTHTPPNSFSPFSLPACFTSKKGVKRAVHWPGGSGGGRGTFIIRTLSASLHPVSHHPSSPPLLLYHISQHYIPPPYSPPPCPVVGLGVRTSSNRCINMRCLSPLSNIGSALHTAFHIPRRLCTPRPGQDPSSSSTSASSSGASSSSSSSSSGCSSSSRSSSRSSRSNRRNSKTSSYIAVGEKSTSSHSDSSCASSVSSTHDNTNTLSVPVPLSAPTPRRCTWNAGPIISYDQLQLALSREDLPLEEDEDRKDDEVSPHLLVVRVPHLALSWTLHAKPSLPFLVKPNRSQRQNDQLNSVQSSPPRTTTSVHSVHLPNISGDGKVDADDLSQHRRSSINKPHL